MWFNNIFFHFTKFCFEIFISFSWFFQTAEIFSPHVIVQMTLSTFLLASRISQLHLVIFFCQNLHQHLPTIF